MLSGICLVNSGITSSEFAEKLKKFSPKGYVTNCAHPSQKGHEAIAKSIYESIIDNTNKEIITNKKTNLI